MMVARLRYAVAIASGAFLLFQIQPLIARAILPWFGGGASVWAAVLMFFQTVLLAGYAYSFALSRLRSLRLQASLHLLLLAASLALLPITPAEAWIPSTGAAPTLRILLLLASTVGLPCLLLSATSPLLQSWYGSSEKASPYWWYAVSNLGSLLGLISYPFVIEPLLGIGHQSVAWTIGYLVFAGSCGWVAVATAQAGGDSITTDLPTSNAPVPWSDSGLQLALPAVGVIILLSVTGQVTENIAPVPFLWVLPLTLYLLSFIVSFAGPRWYNRRFWTSLFAIGLIPALWVPMVWAGIGLPALLVVESVVLFAGCMVCHGELARLQPPSSELTRFYLLVATGGALGGALVTLVAPLVFTGFWELQIGLVAALVLGGICRSREPGSPPGAVVVWCVVGAIVMALGVIPARSTSDYLSSSRSFYGRVSVSETVDQGRKIRALIHGRIQHGWQFQDPALRRTPTLYYRAESGIAAAMRAVRRPGGRRVGVLGLGVGTVAAFGEAGDLIRFYELDPEVERVARRYFTYLQDGPAVSEVILGDARVSLESESSQEFDILILDAFNGGAVPVHLMTREAFEVYDRHLARDGIIIVNVVNTYLDLVWLVRNQLSDLGMNAVWIRTEPDRVSPTRSSWIVASRDRELLAQPTLGGLAQPWPAPASVRWTDDHASVLDVLAW